MGPVLSPGVTSMPEGGLTRFEPRAADGWGPGAMLAVGVHLMLVAALALSVSWKIETPDVVEAEVWDRVPQVAAPAPPPAPEPEPVRPVPTPPTPRVAPPEPEPVPEKPPEIVTKQKKEPPPKERKRPEPKEVFEDVKPPKVKKPEPKPEPKVDPKVEARAKAAAAAEAKARADAQAKADAKAAADREAQRKANLARMMGELGGSSLGTSARSAGPSASYAGRIKARIKPNIVFTENVSGNPSALVEVRCAADGRIISRKLIESSGVPAWDDAVLRAVDRTEILPLDENGRVPSPMQIEFRPKDF